MQAQAIVDMRLRTLVGLERQKIEDEYTELIKTIAELQGYSAQPAPDRAASSRARRSSSRRASATSGAPNIEPAEDEISMEQLIPNIDVVVTYTVGGYIKRVSRRYVPHAEPRRTRRDRHLEPQARGRRAQLLRDQDARSRALLHEQGPRLSAARVRDSRYHAPSARNGAGQPTDAAAGRRGHARSSRSIASKARSIL